MQLYVTVVCLLVSAVSADEELGGINQVRRYKRDVIKDLPMQRVATLPSDPYVYFDAKKTGNDRYSGYLPELMFELSNKLGFQYVFYQPDDKRYGTPISSEDNPNSNKTLWNGMIGELQKNENGGRSGADFAAADITITRQRMEAVAFLHPFAHVGLTVLIQKPHRKGMAPNSSIDLEQQVFDLNFDIFKPLAPEIWVLLMILIVVVWMFNWLMNRYNPYEYGSRHERNLATEEQAELFNISGAFWYTFTILQWQGYDRAPRSLASKVLGCIWMAFVTVTLVTYIGSFVNYLFWASTVHGNTNPLVSPITDLRDLVNHKDEYTYGTIRGGSTHYYLTKVARGDEYIQMAKYWQSDEGKKMLVGNIDEGLDKIRTEKKYALILETPKAKHCSSIRPCDLMLTGIMIGMRSYGVAVPKDSPLKDALDKEIIGMVQSGEMSRLEDRWFSDHQCWNVTQFEKAMSHLSTLYVNEPQRVTIRMFWSPIVIMGVGLIVSGLVALAEFLWYRYRGQYDSSNRAGGAKLTNDDDPRI